MDLAFRSQLKSLIISHEGFRNYPYTDSVGKVTIGIGYNLTDRGMPDDWINDRYDKDMTWFDEHLALDYPWYVDLCDARKMALLDMCYNMGYKTFQTFHKLIFALELRNYDKAADEILRSERSHQAPARSQQNADMMRSGELCSPVA